MKWYDYFIHLRTILNTRTATKAIGKGSTIYIDYTREKLEKKYASERIDVIKKVKLHYENKILSRQDTSDIIAYISCGFSLFAILIALGINQDKFNIDDKDPTTFIFITLLLLVFSILAFLVLTNAHIKSCNTIISILDDIIQKKEYKDKIFKINLEKRKNKKWKPLD